MWQTSSPVEISGPTHPIIGAIWNRSVDGVVVPTPVFIFAFVPGESGNEERHWPEVMAVAAVAADGHMFTASVYEFEIDPAWAAPVAYVVPAEEHWTGGFGPFEPYDTGTLSQWYRHRHPDGSWGVHPEQHCDLQEDDPR